MRARKVVADDGRPVPPDIAHAEEENHQSADQQKRRLENIGPGHRRQPAIDRIAAGDDREQNRRPVEGQSKDRVKREAREIDHARQVDQRIVEKRDDGKKRARAFPKPLFEIFGDGKQFSARVKRQENP